MNSNERAMTARASFFSREQQSSMFELIITELVANLVLGCDHPTAYSVADIN